MFLKITGSKNYKYLQIVKSYRQHGKVKHKVLLNLGRLDVLKNSSGMKQFVKRLNEILNVNLIEPDKLTDAKILNWGYKLYRKFWDMYELSVILNKIKPQKLSFDFAETCFYMAIEHLLSPKSKLSMFHEQGRYMEIKQVGLNHLYRSLDILSENKESIETELFNKSRDLFNCSVDVIFYDCTTFYFETEKKDGFKEFGFSKEGKINHVQVVFGLLIDMEGRPIGYEIFPGNTFEGKTLQSILEKLSKRFGIRKVIVVADKGLMNKGNIEILKNLNYGYIIASRIKNLSEEIKKEILERKDYVKLSEDLEYKEIKTADDRERLIVFYSRERARKDYEERQRLIRKAEELLEKPSKIRASIKRGGRKYIKMVEQISYQLDLEAIKADGLYDGYFGIQTNETAISAEEVLRNYHELWKIEESFRCMKSTLEVRPVFHWTERRIKGHFVMCFIAFLLERALEIELKRKGNKVSSERIKKALNEMNYAEVEVEGRKLLIRTTLSDDAKSILRCVGIKNPTHVLIPERE